MQLKGLSVDDALCRKELSGWMRDAGMGERVV